MKIIITGAYGFIGKNFCDVIREAKENTDEYILLDKNAADAHIANNIIIKQFDIFADDYCVEFENADVLINFAGKYETGAAANFNQELMKKLIVFSERYAIKKIIHLSTVAVYDGLKKDYITEDEAPRAQSVYGKDKLKADELLLDYSTNKNIKCLILRPVSIFGEYRNNLDSLISKIKNHKYLIRFGDAYIRQLLYVKDLCYAVIHLIKNFPVESDSFILSDNSYDNKIKTFDSLIALQYKVLLRYINLPVFLANDYKKLIKIFPDFSHLKNIKYFEGKKIYNMFGYSLKYGCKNALTEMLKVISY